MNHDITYILFSEMFHYEFGCIALSTITSARMDSLDHAYLGSSVTRTVAPAIIDHF